MLCVASLPVNFNSSAIGSGVSSPVGYDSISSDETLFTDSIQGIRNGSLITVNCNNSDKMELTSDTTFNCDWDSNSYSVFHLGQKLDDKKNYDYYKDITCDYNVDFKPENGNSTLGVEISMYNPYTTVYIIDAWKGTAYPESAEYMNKEKRIEFLQKSFLKKSFHLL